MYELKKVEDLAEGDEVVLWTTPINYEVSVLVKDIHIYEEIGKVGIVVEEFEWGEVTAPIGTYVTMGGGW
ncbi:hypothetical protein [Streptosporangium sp. G12]